MKKLVQLYLCLLLVPTIGFTANTNTFQLMGKVMDDNNNYVDVGNVLVLSIADSSMLKGAMFLDGEFLIEGIKETKFLLKVTALGYEDHIQVLENTTGNATVDIGTVVLKTILMEGVEVVARQKIFEQKGDNVVVNVANTSLSSSGTALDILRQSPKVTLNSGNQVSVIGKGEALVYVDGQLVASNEILKSLSSNDLKEIQIIENPSAKYDAAGNAIINIITKNRSIEGFKIGLVQELEKRTYVRAYFKANAYYRISKFMFQTSYGIRPYQHLGQEYYNRTYDFQEKLIDIDNKFENTLSILTHDYSFRTSYKISDDSKIGFQYSGAYTDGEKDAINKNVFLENGTAAFNLNSNVTGPYNQQNNTYSLAYDRTFDTLGSNILITGQYSNFNLDRLELIDQNLVRPKNTSTINWRTNNRNNIDITSFQIDYEKVLPNGMTIGTGAKNAYITNLSNLDFEARQSNGEYKLIEDSSNDYDYNENLLAAYGQLSGANGDWKYSAGLRGEWTKTNGISGAAEGGLPIVRDYINVFPSASLTKTLTDDISANLSYNYRVQRPRFQDLNPFVLYVDSLASLRGNSDLVPEYIHSVASAVNFKSFTLNLNYSYIKDRISTLIEITDPENPGAFSFVRDNIEFGTMYAASITVPLEKKWWSSYNVFGGRMESHHFLDGGQTVINQKAGYYLYTRQAFSLPSDVKVEVNFQYTSPRVDGIYTDNPISNLSVAVSRKFFDNHLTLRLLAHDIFDKYKFTGISTFDNTNLTYLSAGDQRYIKLSLNWDFGKLSNNSVREKKISTDELQRITQ